jgi:riboflavin kinase / FMN adenylyltransferase
VEVVSLGELTTSGPGTAVTIGAYDGVHLGHRRLLAHLRAEADAQGLRTAVVTFDRHPATVVRPESAPLLLTATEHKLELLAACGVDLTLVVPFDEQRADETAEDFVADVLVQALRARLVVVGENFHFGHGRKGDVALLSDLGRDQGFAVEGVPLVGDEPDGGDHVVSSTRIRRLVADGEVGQAAVLLARPHEVRGSVVHGDGRGGAVLGFPTANVEVPQTVAVPGVGIYAGWYRRADGSLHRAAISYGRRPTFYGDGHGGTRGSAVRPVLEAHLLDFEGDLYGEAAGVAFVERLHDERRFDSVAELVSQMHHDVARARAILGG